MRIPDHPTLIRRMHSRRLKKVACHTPVLAASLVVLDVRCGRRTCRCQQGGPLHIVQRLTFKDRGKTRTVHVPKDLIMDVRLWITEHKRLTALLKEIHALSPVLVRPHLPSAPQGGAALIAGTALVLTVGHFFPELNRWLDRLPDTRDADARIYVTRFLGWWGIHLPAATRQPAATRFRTRRPRHLRVAQPQSPGRHRPRHTPRP